MSVHGAINMRGLVERMRIRILQTSASGVYRDPAIHPQVESYTGNICRIGTRACDDEDERRAETLFFGHHRQFKLEVKISRIFSSYGERMHPNDGRVLSNFILQTRPAEAINIYGDGQQTQPFCDAEDLAQGLLKLMRLEAFVTGRIDLRNPTEFTLLALAEHVAKRIGSMPTIARSSLPQDDPRRRRPDSGIARSVLGWQPSLALEHALQVTIRFLDELLPR
jgi:UDP-glucuronate decarboxylase